MLGRAGGRKQFRHRSEDSICMMDRGLRGKRETAALLRGLGFSLMEIAAELYPRDYERYLQTRDPRLRRLLKKRVWRLLRPGGPRDGSRVDPSAGWTPDALDDSGGEREPLEHRAPVPLMHPSVRKAGMRGVERQVVEYEQLLYHYYRRAVERYDDSGAVWATARFIHGRAFREYYDVYKANVWRVRSAGRVARTYAYAVLSVAVLMHGLYHLRFELESRLEPDREILKDVLPIILAHIL